MQAASRMGDVCSGHGCFPPRPSITGATKVFIDGQPALRLGDQFAVHVCGTSSHAGEVDAGSTKVFVEGLPLARIGDPVDCGSILAQGSEKVFAA